MSSGLSSFTLKVVAIVGMTCNHASWIFAAQLPFPLYCLMSGVGGLTFPTMAFLLAEGWRHTSNCKRYIARLAVFALVAQVPYSLFLEARPNVLFTLLIGLVILYLHDVMESRLAWAGTAVAGVALSCFCDWGFIGVGMILLAAFLPTVRQRALGSALLACVTHGLAALAMLAEGSAEGIATLLYAVGNGTAGALMCFYDGRRGLPLKWFFYAYYPAHIAILGAAHLIAYG